jgi:hypothetical protein
LGQHGGQQPRQSRHVAFAVVEDVGPLGFRPRAASQYQVPHLGLLGGADAIKPVVSKGAKEARTIGGRYTVRLVPELGE